MLESNAAQLLPKALWTPLLTWQIFWSYLLYKSIKCDT
jgi:hypothetical protein